MLISRFVMTAVVVAAASGEAWAQRGGMTPEQRQERARQAYEEEAAKPRPIAAIDSVWIEDMTYMEVRDAMKAGKTTALLFAGSTEQNGPYLPGGKHQIALKLIGEAIARELGDALVAPIVPIEAGDPDNEFLEWGSLYFTAETFQAVVRDMARSLKSQGFEHIMLLGDSGGNTRGLAAVAEQLSAEWGGSPSIHHIAEFYNWASGEYSVRDFVQDAGIPEDQGADGIHDEYGLTAVMMAADPKHVRYEQRAAADLLTINGVDISDREAVAAMGRKIIEFRTKVAVEAIQRTRVR